MKSAHYPTIYLDDLALEILEELKPRFEGNKSKTTQIALFVLKWASSLGMMIQRDGENLVMLTPVGEKGRPTYRKHVMKISGQTQVTSA